MQDPEQLRFLYVHTYCDASGTAPALWNDYKETMHRTLFQRTLEQFEAKHVIEKKRSEEKTKLYQKILEQASDNIGKDEIEAHFTGLPERYFINNKPAEITLHLSMVHQLLTQIQNEPQNGTLAPIIDWCNDIDLNVTVVNVVTWDRAGLFYKLAGALTLAGVNIVSTKAVSRTDHITIDTFYIMDPDGGALSGDQVHQIFKTHIDDALMHGRRLTGEIERLEAKVKSQKKKLRGILPAPIPPKVEVYHEPSLDRTIIEVQAEDRIGLLYGLARLIYSRGYNITFARISTERGIAMDTFYIEKVNSRERIRPKDLIDLKAKLDVIANQ
jgi:[protein-PII] uridylyltransferase